MKGHENKYDWTFKEEDTYTLTIKNPTVEEEGTYNVSGQWTFSDLFLREFLELNHSKLKSKRNTNALFERKYRFYL